MTYSGTYYDQVALIAPGSLAIIMLGWISGRTPPNEWMAAGAGALAILALGGLAIGFVLAQITSRLTHSMWRFFKPPSVRCLQANNGILHEVHRDQAIQDAKRLFGLDAPPTEEEWRAYFRHCVSEASSGKKASRVELFLGQYSLARNLTLLSVPFVGQAIITHDWLLVGLGAVALMATASATWFFDRLYVSEVFVAYLGDL